MKMQKILRLLATVGLVATPIISIVACGNKTTPIPVVNLNGKYGVAIDMILKLQV